MSSELAAGRRRADHVRHERAGRVALNGDTPGEWNVRLASLQAWREWLSEHAWARDPGYIESIVQLSRGLGVMSRFLGPVPPAEISVPDSNYRESLLARGLNPRLRAMLDLFLEQPGADDTWTTRIYAPEGLTEFARVMRGRYFKFLGSEYAPTPETRAAIFPIPHQDATRLTFPDGVFDYVLSNDILEHVSDLPTTVRECARVIRRGGALLATFPFADDRDETIVRATVQDGVTRTFGEPEYHGNPLDPEAGSLVFQVLGWDILELCRSQGFRSAEMIFVSSAIRGIVGAELAGVFLLRTER
jgi:hypothetical protein